jgi:hypothetical protein
VEKAYALLLTVLIIALLAWNIYEATMDASPLQAPAQRVKARG